MTKGSDARYLGDTAKLKIAQGMTSQVSTGKGKTCRERRTWTLAEDDALITGLEEACAKGLRCDNGTFKSGTLVSIALTLNVKFPGANIRAVPHVESALKRLKTAYNLYSEVCSISGFGWNPTTNCIHVDDESVWDAYVESKTNKKQLRELRFTPFHFYDRMCVVFGKDRATGEHVETPADMVENVEREEASLRYAPEDIEITLPSVESTPPPRPHGKKRKPTGEVGSMIEGFKAEISGLMLRRPHICSEQESLVAEIMKVEELTSMQRCLILRKMNLEGLATIFLALDDQHRRDFIISML